MSLSLRYNSARHGATALAGCKVTGLSDHHGHAHWDYRQHRYVYPITARDFHAANAERFARRAPPTAGDRANQVRALATCGSRPFRLVDSTGRSRGPRYRNLADIKPKPMHDRYLCEDQHGRRIWLSGTTRVRTVDRQPETVHSQASRIINQLHRELTKERTSP